jgi:hypothetical protein
VSVAKQKIAKNKQKIAYILSGGASTRAHSAHMHVYTSIRLHVYTAAHMLVCTHAHMHTCTHAHMHVCTSTRLPDGPESTTRLGVVWHSAYHIVHSVYRIPYTK